ncbi:helix-turn-helix domain-containing protein [Marinobacter salicampi]|uniref:helix-turn-helix domain-containing protein n=1 Tax=Marinobacter salicampi TaxID=435907 RepID=UPI00140A48E3|nr:helix-turn-helix transcriptional regulator [Marinobacter salicampi]
MTLGEALKCFRKAKRLTLVELARLANSYEGNLSRIERNTSNPSMDLLYRLADSLDVSLTELFQLAENRHSDEIQTSLNTNFLRMKPSDRSLLVAFSDLLQTRYAV